MVFKVPVLCGLFVSVACSHVCAAQCANPQWSTEFGYGADSASGLRCFQVYDDGSGPALYAGGVAYYMGGTFNAGGILKWSTAHQRWENVGGPEGAFDASGGGSPFNPPEINDMVVWDPDGAGPQRPLLVVCGDFNSRGLNPPFSPAFKVAAWDGTTWTNIGSGINGGVNNYFGITAFAMAVYQGDLYVGGAISSGPYGGVLKLDTSTNQWIGVGEADLINGPVQSLAVYNDGTGEQLFAGGYFTQVNIRQPDNSYLTVPQSGGLASWNGTQWTGRRPGALLAPTQSVGVGNLKALDIDGPGPLPTRLFAAGFPFGFMLSGAVPMALPAPLQDCDAFTVYGTGANTALHGIANSRLYTWNGSGSPVQASSKILFGRPGDKAFRWAAETDFFTYDFGQGPVLLMSQFFAGTSVAPGWPLPVRDLNAQSVLTWDGGQFGVPHTNQGLHWLSDETQCFGCDAGFAYNDQEPVSTGGVMFDADGPGPEGPALHVLGYFNRAGDQDVQGGIAKWNGSSWSTIGIDSSAFPPDIKRITTFSPVVFDDGSGPAIFAAYLGYRNEGDESPIRVFYGVFKFQNNAWSSVGPIESYSAYNLHPWIDSVAVYNDGTGPALYAGGRFSSLGGNPANSIAKWTGSQWVAVGSGVANAALPDEAVVRRLVTHNDGTGEKLYAIGGFTHAGGQPANNVARWDGTSWSAVGNFPAPNNQQRPNFTAVSIPSGPSAGLYVTRPEHYSGSVWVWPSVFRWDGSSWQDISAVPGLTNPGFAWIGSYDDGSGLKPYAALNGGTPQSAGGFTSAIYSHSASGWSPVNASALVGYVGSMTPVTSVGDTSIYFFGSIFGTDVANVSFYDPNGRPRFDSTPSHGLARLNCATPTCPPDFNHSGTVTVQDIFDFLNAYFNGSLTADFNHSGATTVQDIFDFLAAYFLGCP